MPTPSSRLQFQDYQFQVVLSAGPWKWTTRVDVSRSTPAFEIRDVFSPYGRLYDSIPIPGEVIEEMAASITKIQQSFAPSILLSPLNMLFTVDEGRGVSSPQLVQVTNDGLFGSLLGVSVSSSASFVASTPANLSGLASSESGQFQVAADSTNLTALGSPYAIVLTVQDPTASNNPQQIPVTVVVRPKAVINLLPTTMTYTVTKPLSGPFPPIPSQQFQLQNTGDPASVLNYQIQRLTNNSPWITSVSPAFGSVNGGGAQPVTVVVQPDDSMYQGTYVETLRVSGYSTNYYQDVTVTLTIT